MAAIGKYWMTAANAVNPTLIKAPLADVMQDPAEETAGVLPGVVSTDQAMGIVKNLRMFPVYKFSTPLLFACKRPTLLLLLACFLMRMRQGTSRLQSN